MSKRGLSLALILPLLLTACAGSGVTALTAAQAPSAVVAAIDPELDQAMGDFGLELLRQTRQEGENTFISPLSVLLCLSMTANGAAEETLTQFETVLAGDGSLEDLNGNCRSLLDLYSLLDGDDSLAELYGITPGETTLSIADSLWLDPRVQAEDAFIGRCTDTYQAGMFSADFTEDAACKEINAWIKKNTGGHIENAVEEISPDTVLALVNAVYFEGKWVDEFELDSTWEDQPFYREDGEIDQVDLMRSGGRTGLFIGAETAQGVLLPYRDGRLAFLALLPEDGTALADYLDSLDGARLAELISGAEEEYFALLLPKFEMMWKGSLAEPLEAMGLDLAFDPDRADFSLMGTDVDGNPLYVSTIEHGAGIQVDEQGTKAYAYTFESLPGNAAPPTEVLTFNHPFVYGIVDLRRGIPLFLGTFETAES